MDHDKLNDFAVISATITCGLESLLKAQDLLVSLMCKECDIPDSMKYHMMDDMNKVIGIKRL